MMRWGNESRLGLVIVFSKSRFRAHVLSNISEIEDLTLKMRARHILNDQSLIL